MVPSALAIDSLILTYTGSGGGEAASAMLAKFMRCGLDIGIGSYSSRHMECEQLCCLSSAVAGISSLGKLYIGECLTAERTEHLTANSDCGAFGKQIFFHDLSSLPLMPYPWSLVVHTGSQFTNQIPRTSPKHSCQLSPLFDYLCWSADPVPRQPS